MKISHQYRAFIWAIITTIFILLWQPAFAELEDLKNKHFRWSAVFILILMFLELPATITKASGLYHHKEFDNNLFSNGINSGLVFFIFLFRLIFVLTAVMLALSQVFVEAKTTHFVVITLVIVVITKEIISGIFTFTPITKFKPSVYLVWIAENSIIGLLSFTHGHFTRHVCFRRHDGKSWSEVNIWKLTCRSF